MDINDTTVICKNEKEIDLSSEVNVMSKILRRTIDICIGLIGTCFLIPLSLIIKIIYIISKDTDSIMFVQERIGKNGRIFKIYKYRTMVVGAEDKLKDLLENNKEIREEYNENKKIKYDPRITKYGDFLRKTSLDEFPQFINVLKGDMTLIGPRPYLKSEIKDMGDYYNKIIALKPGLTGLWQISGRSNLNFEDRLKLDEEYYKNNSLWLDAKIFVKTIKTVLCRKGAI